MHPVPDCESLPGKHFVGHCLKILNFGLYVINLGFKIYGYVDTCSKSEIIINMEKEENIKN